MVARRTDAETDYTRGTDELANLLAAEIDRQELTRSSVAEVAGISRVVLSNWLNGRRNINACDAIAVARVLGYELALVRSRTD